MKRERFLKILGLGAVAAPVAGTAVFRALAAVVPAPNPSDKLLMDSIESLMNSQTDPGTYTVWTGKEGMRAFDEALKEFAEYGKEQERKIMYGIVN